jgi:hypothetical protein
VSKALRTALHAVLGMPPPLKRALVGRPVRVDGQDLDRHTDLVHGFATALGVGPRPRQAVAEAAVALRAALVPPDLPAPGMTSL